MIYYCDRRRRAAVKEHDTLNGIDYLEVWDDPAGAFDQRQRYLFVRFLNEHHLAELSKENIVIEGGDRIATITITSVAVGPLSPPPGSPPPASSPPEANVLTITVDRPGDFSMYTLRLVRGTGGHRDEAPEGFDPVLSKVQFTFKAGCPSDFDCKADRDHPGQVEAGRETSYLAKDYASFRQLMLDRMAVLMPQWRQRNPADVGMTLVELLAYVGDYLSYRQDAIATEAYLGTARRRVSVRRHARLVDYHMHDGCNARVWVRIQVAAAGDRHVLHANQNGLRTQFLTCARDQPKVIRPHTTEYERAVRDGTSVFELMHDITLFYGHNHMRFHTWSARECCLAQGAVSATLRGEYPDLKGGDVLILAEVRNPRTGTRADADPSKRHAVRLTKVSHSFDPLGASYAGSPPASPADGPGVPITEIEWHPDDKLPFALCLASYNGKAYIEDVSVAWGNIALADHGRTIVSTPDETHLSPDTVPLPHSGQTPSSDVDGKFCQQSAAVQRPPRFRPSLRHAPLTHAAPYGPEVASASASMHWSMKSVLPCITLSEVENGQEPIEWVPKRELLASGPHQREFVVETESDGTARLRFGDNKFGLHPRIGHKFMTTYRIGNGRTGNVGAEAIGRLVSEQVDGSLIETISNPLPAQGGTNPEMIEQCRQQAPAAFRVQERAVTPKDYADLVQRGRFDVQRAAATFRWTGSWYTSFVTVDRLGGMPVDEPFKKTLCDYLERYRMAGQDVEIDAPRYVSLELEMIVCVDPGFFPGDVKAALLDVFSNGIRPNGRRGVFHPDNFSFGQTVFLSPIYAAAQSVAGVASVKITKFRRQGREDTKPLADGKLELERLEIARLDNDANHRERGVLELIMKGGR